MAHLADASRGSDVVARWCNLAEQRLEHLTELFETGRWRRYHSELAFLENIQEAKTAVETWRGLMTGEAVPDKPATDVAGLVAEIPALARHDEVREQLEYFPPEPVTDAGEPLLEREIPDDVLAALESQLMALDKVPSVPAAPDLDDLPLPPLDLDMMQERYPLLRNAL